MPAKIDWNATPCDAPALPDYSGFPFWEAFVAEPNKERKVCDFLHEKLGIDLYWPHFTSKRRRRGSFYVACMKSVIPGVLLAPVEYLAGRDRDRILDWVHLRPLRLARPLTKAEIDEVRNMEASLNIPVPESGPLLTIGQCVGFVSDIYAEKLVEAVVLEVASGGRIRIRSKGKLIGGIDTFWISSAELEAK